VRTIDSQDKDAEQRDENRVPVKDPHISPRQPVCPKRRKEIPIRIQRHAPNHVAENEPQDGSQGETRTRKCSVPKGPPNGTVDVGAQLQGEATPDEQPQHGKNP
jgi:hypothetical protein